MKPAVMIFVLLAQTLCGQAIWTDSFQNVSYLTQSVWFGDTSLFIVNNDDKLQLQAFGSGSSRLYRGSSAGHQSTWKFHIELGFNPSSSNHCRVYLAKADNSGLYVAFGEGGRDAIELGYTYSGLDSTWGRSASVLDSSLPSGILKVVQDSVGVYRVFWNPSNGIQKLLFSCSGPPSIPSSLLEIQCTYTSTRSDKFWFDDFEVNGRVHRDLYPPKITSLHRTEESIQLSLSSPVSGAPLLWSNGENAFVDSIFDASQILLEKPKTEGIWTVDLSGLKDTLGRSLDSVLTQYQLGAYSQDWFPTEIFSDPTPSRGLPNIEFVELQSRLNMIVPEGVLVVNGDSLSTPPLELNSNFPVILSNQIHPHATQNWVVPGFYLPNDSGVISWYDYNQTLVWQARYHSNSHNEMGKSGGYSLEVLGEYPQCPCWENWTTTSHREGGSPGEFSKNNTSVKYHQPLSYADNGNLAIGFHTPILPKKTKAFWKSEGAVFPVHFDPNQPEYIFVPLPFHSDSLLFFPPLIPCTKDTLISSLYFELPIYANQENSKPLVISEILFDAQQSSEFIELANPNSTSIYLHNVWLGEYWQGSFYRTLPVGNPEIYYILPGLSPVAISNNLQRLNHEGGVTPLQLQLYSWAALSDVEGSVAIEHNDTILYREYSRSQHPEDLTDPNDYSLALRNGLEGTIVSVNMGSPGWFDILRNQAQGILSISPSVYKSGNIPIEIAVTPENIEDEYSLYIIDEGGRILWNGGDGISGEGLWHWEGCGTNGSPLPIGPYYVICKFEDAMEIKKCAVSP